MAVYFTDSQRPVIYKVATAASVGPGPVTTIPLGGDYSACRRPVQPERDRRDAERQDADRRADHLAQAARRSTRRPASPRLIDLGGYDLTNGDGLLLHGRTLYVVQNRDNKVAVFELSPDLSSGDIRARDHRSRQPRRPDDDRPLRQPPVRRQRPLRDDDADRPGLPRRQASLDVCGGVRPRAAPRSAFLDALQPHERVEDQVAQRQEARRGARSSPIARGSTKTTSRSESSRGCVSTSQLFQRRTRPR